MRKGHKRRGQNERSRPEMTLGIIRERERPEPSSVWQTVGIVFVGFAFAGLLGALNISDEAVIRRSELWILTGSFASMALICFLAHWDVNRGRKTREWEIEERAGRGS